MYILNLLADTHTYIDAQISLLILVWSSASISIYKAYIVRFAEILVKIQPMQMESWWNVANTQNLYKQN